MREIMECKMARRTDANQKDFVKEARKLGATVHDTSMVGLGFPDLVIGWRGQNILLETKNGEKPESQTKLTPYQEKWHTTWRGKAYVFRYPSELINLLLTIK